MAGVLNDSDEQLSSLSRHPGGIQYEHWSARQSPIVHSIHVEALLHDVKYILRLKPLIVVQ
eukprot:scaffold741_cov336-Pavlova_lutheri.AAC.30